jgi:hypothetical protein
MKKMAAAFMKQVSRGAKAPKAGLRPGGAIGTTVGRRVHGAGPSPVGQQAHAMEMKMTGGAQ